MNQSLSHPPLALPSSAAWMHDRLIEARGVLSDTTRHSESLVILAARVDAGRTDRASECAEAIDLLRQLDRRPLHTIAAASFANGGAA